MNFRDAPIKKKLTDVIMLTSTVVVLLTASAFVTYEVVTVRKNFVQSAQALAEVTAADCSAAVSFEDQTSAEDILSMLKAKPIVLCAALYLKNGKLLARYPKAAPAQSFPTTLPARDYVLERKALDVYVPVMVGDRAIGTLYLQWGLGQVYERFRWYGGLVAAILLGTLGIAYLISNWLQKRISQPILELAEAAHAVSVKKDYRIRARKYGEDELGLLTEAFNQMLAEIHERDAALRENEGHLLSALKAAEAYAGEVRVLNTALEERVARRTSELAASNQELEAFTYSVSHDLRAPLRHIDAFAQILHEEYGAGASPEAGKYIDRIRAGVQNMGHLVDDLLNLSRIGRTEVKQEAVDVNQLVRDIIADLTPDLAGREIEWRIGQLPVVKGDAGLLRQVFVNLLDNAIKYTGTRAAALIEIGQETVEGQAAIFVRDNGVGFDMKYADKLFGVFQRLHRQDEFEGAGIGLATVRRIIQLHGGKIWVNAELDKGAAFHFILRSRSTASLPYESSH
jgi:signal transduction histidine kinase